MKIIYTLIATLCLSAAAYADTPAPMPTPKERATTYPRAYPRAYRYNGNFRYWNPPVGVAPYGYYYDGFGRLVPNGYTYDAYGNLLATPNFGYNYYYRPYGGWRYWR